MESIKTVDKWGNIEYKNEKGQIHRTDGPAYESKDGYNEWYINNKRHREDGPAVEYPDGHKEWWINGICHREDGPAVNWADGRVSFYLKDKEYSKEDYEQEITKIKLKRILDL